jgi:hypothetical protein
MKDRDFDSVVMVPATRSPKLDKKHAEGEWHGQAGVTVVRGPRGAPEGSHGGPRKGPRKEAARERAVKA